MESQGSDVVVLEDMDDEFCVLSLHGPGLAVSGVLHVTNKSSSYGVP